MSDIVFFVSAYLKDADKVMPPANLKSKKLIIVLKHICFSYIVAVRFIGGVLGLAIVLSVFRFTVSDYPFGIFNHAC
jgi:hypothetical protein